MLFGHVLAPVYVAIFFDQLRMFIYESPWNILPGGFYFSVIAILLAMTAFNFMMILKRFVFWVVSIFNVCDSATYMKIHKTTEMDNGREDGKCIVNKYNPLDNFSNPPHPGNPSNVYYESYYGEDD
jgi:hypothetical protein